MAAPGLEELFEDSRITQWDWTLLLLLLYTPIGIVLLLIRVFALIQFYVIFVYLPFHPIRKYLLRICGSVLGVVINENRLSKLIEEEASTWVSNHCSPFDWIVLQGVAKTPKSVIFPEGDTTSGKKGLLKFQLRVLEQLKQNNPNLTVQPLALKVSRPFPSFSVTALDSSVWADIFFLLFSPCTTFNIRFLEPTQCCEDEEASSYMGRIETAIAQALGISMTSFTVKDKEELIKRKRMDMQHPVIVRRANSRLQAMASQVKEVLPHVPMATIISDLGRTNSINATVANLVEGVVPFTPEPVAPPVPTAVAPAASTSSGPSRAPSQISASTFGKSVLERGLSLQERKQRLLQEARRRYCDKHGLQLVGINC